MQLTALPLVGLSVLLAWGAPALADIIGKPRVIDGDTIEIAGQRIRLHGIDAPESRQTCEAGGETWPCGQQASLALADKIGTANVACEDHGMDQYDRTIAVCRLGDLDLNGWLVAEGWAMAYRYYSTAYVHQEDDARAAGRGEWRGRFVPPWDWRRGERLAVAVPPSDCAIKGNINRDGEHIYHLPETRWYDRTRISLERGERWFCSEADAKAAGWRPAR